MVGLKNLGNTCYLNAALQALSNCPPITNLFIEHQNSDKIPSLSKHYMKLMKTIWSTNSLNTSLVPIDILNEIANINPIFSGNLQHDAHEVLITLLNNLDKDLKSIADIMFTDIVDQIQCTSCAIISEKVDKVQDLSIPITNVAKKLIDCLTVYFSKTDLKGDNMYSCEICKKLREGIKYSKILKLPEVNLLLLSYI